jgi:hypothetical protein
MWHYRGLAAGLMLLAGCQTVAEKPPVARSEQHGEPAPDNAFAALNGNRFSNWTISPRLEFPSHGQPTDLTAGPSP